MPISGSNPEYREKLLSNDVNTSDSTDEHKEQPPVAVSVLSQAIAESHPSNTATSNGKSALYYTVLGSAYWSLVGELLFAWFTRKYVAMGITDTFNAIGIEMPELPEGYGDNLSLAHPSIELVSDLLTLADLVANLTGFDPKGEAAQFEANLPDGLSAGMKHYLSRVYREFGTVGITTLLMTINFIAGAWADVEPLYNALDNAMGSWKWGPISMVMYGGVSYYIFFSAQDVLNSINFLLNKETPTPTLPQQYLWERIKDRGEIAMPLQVFIEGHTQNVNRMFAFAFLLGRSAQQFGFSSVGVLVAQMLGGASGLGVSLLTRYPRAYQKYYGTNANRLDLITREQQLSVKELLASNKKSLLTRVWNSLKTLVKNPPIAGLAQAASPAYFAGSRVAALVAGMTAVEAWLPIAVGLGAGAIGYLPYKYANDNRELNEFIMKQPKYRYEIEKRIVTAQVEALKTATKAHSNADESNPTKAAEQVKTLATHLLSSARKLNVTWDELHATPEVRINIEGSANTVATSLLASDDASDSKEWIDEQIELAKNSIKDINKELNLDEEKFDTVSEPAPVITTPGSIIATSSNFGSQLARVFTGISSNLGVLKGKMDTTDIVAASASFQTATAVNNFDYMQPKSKTTISQYGIFQRKPVKKELPAEDVTQDHSLV
ncbi:MAG: hypothetical protein P4M12_08925 [Gammaproteobacteria bacterium]|nr:hypothetical protein [Gammaproteobacteria bacterium]